MQARNERAAGWLDRRPGTKQGLQRVTDMGPMRSVLYALLLLALAGCGLVGANSGGGEVVSPAVAPTQPGVGATPTLSATPTSPPPTPVPSPTLTLLSGRPSLGDPFTPELGNTGYDVHHYDLKLALNPALSRIEGVVTIEAETAEDNLRQISLDFIGYEIAFVMVEEEPANFRREGGKLWVEFPQPFMSAGTPFTMAVAYAGQPVQEDSPYIHYTDYLGLVFLENSTFYTISEPDGARYWFPCNDHPLDKATFRSEFTVPQGLAVLGNGQLVNSWLSEMPDGSEGATFVWEHEQPMATYLALAAGGHYRREEGEAPNGIPLIYYFFPELEEEYLEAVDVTPEVMVWLSEMLGPYPFESYGQATYYAMGISMEMQTMTLLSYQMLDERTVVHEMSHSWFGNWVGIDTWGDTWWKEGLATYMEVLWLSRDDPAERERLMAEIGTDVAERGQDYPLDQPPRERIMSFDSYYRGAQFMYGLHQEVGDDAFFSGLRAFLSRNGGGNAGAEALLGAMEEAAGRELDAFFAQWLSAELARE